MAKKGTWVTLADGQTVFVETAEDVTPEVIEAVNAQIKAYVEAVNQQSAQDDKEPPKKTEAN